MGIATEQAVEHVDVLIIGAGISGIGAAFYLQRDHPQRSYAIVESRATTGGTWDLFKYPGIRSDSDLHTFGYDFKPWESEYSIADGPDILAYIRETASENGMDPHIRTSRKVSAMSFSTENSLWTVEIEPTDGGEPFQMTANFVFLGTGYYDYEQGFTPDFPGLADYEGQVIHPQFWPEDLDYEGKKVVVIGSGATAVTLLPAMAKKTEHITMLQRSPTYVLPLPAKDPVSTLAKRVLGLERGYAVARRWNILLQSTIYKLCQRHPQMMRNYIRRVNKRCLPEDYPVDVHFRPKYGPWDQRLCAVPNGDLFRAISNGSASVVTDQIETFTPEGLRLRSGQKLDADIIITATGLKLNVFGGIKITVDGEPVLFQDHLAFKGMMLSGVPNLVFLIGYTNSSWTLKVCLVCQHFMRMLSYMDEHGYDAVAPQPPYPGMSTRPLLDFSAGYVQRSLAQLPRQGAYEPWVQSMSVKTDTAILRDGPVEDRNLEFRRKTAMSAAPEAAVEVVA